MICHAELKQSRFTHALKKLKKSKFENLIDAYTV